MRIIYTSLSNTNLNLNQQDSHLRSSSRASQWMPVPVFVDQVFRRHLPDCTKPLRTPGTHPDEIAGSHGIPRVAQPVNAAAFQHDEAMFHYVHLDHTQR